MPKIKPKGELVFPYSALYYVPPGAGSISLACRHDIRYPDICPDCKIDKK